MILLKKILFSTLFLSLEKNSSQQSEDKYTNFDGKISIIKI
jgi:hypothetical protein